jgi:hypothetical protein
MAIATQASKPLTDKVNEVNSRVDNQVAKAVASQNRDKDLFSANRDHGTRFQNRMLLVAYAFGASGLDEVNAAFVSKAKDLSKTKDPLGRDGSKRSDPRDAQKSDTPKTKDQSEKDAEEKSTSQETQKFDLVEHARSEVGINKRSFEGSIKTLAKSILPSYKGENYDEVVNSATWFALSVDLETQTKAFGERYKVILESSKNELEAVNTREEYNTALRNYSDKSRALFDEISEAAKRMKDEEIAQTL